MRFWYRLRTILVLLAIVCISLGAYAQALSRAKAQRIAVGRLTARGCFPWREEQFNGVKTLNVIVNGIDNPTKYVSINSTPSETTWLRTLFGDELFEQYTVVQTPWDAKFELSEIKSDLMALPSLEHLVIDNDQFLVTEIEQLKIDMPFLKVTILPTPKTISVYSNEQNLMKQVLQKNNLSPPKTARPLTLNELSRRSK